MLISASPHQTFTIIYSTSTAKGSKVMKSYKATSPIVRNFPQKMLHSQLITTSTCISCSSCECYSFVACEPGRMKLFHGLYMAHRQRAPNTALDDNWDACLPLRRSFQYGFMQTTQSSLNEIHRNDKSRNSRWKMFSEMLRRF